MANQGFINTSQLDFLTYKESLKQYLRQQEQFQDYDFDGSNLSVLLDLLAYNTYHNAMYLNMVGSEMFLDTAQLRESVVSHAKELNYVPRSRSASSVELTVIAQPNDNPDLIVLPKFYTIQGNNGVNSYTFSTNDSVVLTRENNYSSNAVFFEGIVRTQAFYVTANNASNTFVLSSNTIDVSSIQVEVVNSASDLTVTKYNKADSIFGLDPDSEVFFVQAAEEFRYGIYFGNNVLGKKLVPGNIVTVTYRDCSGAESNGVGNFKTTTPAYGYSAGTFSLVANASADGGAQAEDVDSIKYNAVRSFSAQNRAVTLNDYITILKAEFPGIQTITAYGGEQATPKRYGKVIISAKPFGGEIVSASLKRQMLSFLADKTPIAIEPVIVDPEYMYVEVSTKVKYDLNKTILTSNQIRNYVVSAITTFSDQNLSNFSSDLRVSKLVGAIDAADESIISNDTKIRIAKRISPINGVPFKQVWSFENELYSENVRYQLPIGHEPIISSTTFQYNGYTAQIQDNGLGNLYVYTTIDGQNTILQPSVGSVNYTTGEVNLTNLVVSSYEGDYIKVFAKLENSDIDILTNKILLIAQEDVKVSVTGIRA